MAGSLLDALIRAVDKEATAFELETGRGKSNAEKYLERVGYSKGMRKAIEIMMKTARAVNSEDAG